MLLGIDLETTGLDTGTCHVTEVGAVLWDEETGRPVRVFNSLVRGGVPTPETVAINGITAADLEGHGNLVEEVTVSLVPLYLRADFLVAHNATNFDKPIWNRVFPGFNAKPWVDTSVDVPYPNHITTRKLTHLAAEHGFLNPFPHRALFDAMTMMWVLSNYNWAVVKACALEPSVNLVANISYDDRERVKARGYRWNPGERTWVKTVKQSQIQAERDAGIVVRVAT